MKLLITGISGLLGNNLGLYFREKAEVTGLYRTHPVTIPGVKTLAVDLCDYAAVRKLIVETQPDVIIHCASRTDVDGIERDREGGWQANVWTTRVLLDACRDSNAAFIYISTDAVYPGTEGPYSEESETAPCNWYGSTKLEAERLVAERDGSLILRTNIYGWNIQNKESLAEWFLNRLQKKSEVQGFADARFSSVYTLSLARILEQCLQKQLSGLYNCSCSDSLSKYEFGQQIATLFDLGPDLVQESSLAQAGLAAVRGHDMGLDVRKLAKDLGHPLLTMQESLQQFHADWQAGLPGAIKQNNSLISDIPSYPCRQNIPYGSQMIDEEDIKAVVTTLKSPYLTQGPRVQQFEDMFAATVGAEHAVAVSSGTAALHIACLAAGIGPGDEVITSPNTFVASANCAVYCGARPVFADIDPRTYNISPAEIEKRITVKTKAVIPVHFAGQSCDMESISHIVKEAEKRYGHRIFIIEDGCHALGSRYKGASVGSCAYSDMTVFSFHPVKHITTGEGGAVVSNDADLDRSLRRLRSHGITSTAAEFNDQEQATASNPWYYEQQELGFNYRMTDIQASLGISQLQKLDAFKGARRRIVTQYNEAFQKLDTLQIPYESPHCDSNFHLYVLRFDFQALGIERAELMRELREKGIQTQVHYIPVHTQPYFQKTFGTQLGDNPVTEEYYGQCLSIPLFPGMSDDDVEKVVHAFRELL